VVDDLSALGSRIVDILGEGASRELLGAISRPQEDRAALIGRLFVRNDATWLADLLTDLETDEMLRLRIAEGLRRALPEA
jgi:hypothetical protein